jgi:hypothetical protein
MAGGKLDALGGRRRNRQRQERIVVQLGRLEPVEAVGLELGGGWPGLADVVLRQGRDNAHGALLPMV